jgi:rod shape-determining protein MreD
MGPAFAAVCAGIAALLEATITSRYHILDSQLQIALVFVVATTIVYGFSEGMTWAFVGGLCMDFFAMRPLGSTVFELLIVVALVAAAEPLLSRRRYPATVAAVAIATPVFLVVSNVTSGLIIPPAPHLGLRDLVLAAAANAIVAAVLCPLVIAIRRRSEKRERLIWWR